MPLHLWRVRSLLPNVLEEVATSVDDRLLRHAWSCIHRPCPSCLSVVDVLVGAGAHREKDAHESIIMPRLQMSCGYGFELLSVAQDKFNLLGLRSTNSFLASVRRAPFTPFCSF